ncbi:MAG: hypothetical protein LBR65_02645 [Culturomica sp.]|jgi:hypothetical protein|nr:hypothetical protein [Culturomica sp.]
MNKLAILFIAACCLFSCYEDKGNYDYDWQNAALINTLRDTTVKRGDTLYLAPDIVEVVMGQEGAEVILAAEPFNPDNYEYAWILVRGSRRDTLSRKIDFAEPVLLAGVSEPYRIELFVINKKTGVAAIDFFSLTVVNNYKSGMLFLVENEGQTSELNMFANTADDREVWEKGMLASGDFRFRGGKPISVMYQQYWGAKRLWVMTDEGTGWLDSQSLTWDSTRVLGRLIPGNTTDRFTDMRPFRTGTTSTLYGFFTENGGLRMIGRAGIVEQNIAFLGNASEQNRIRISSQAALAYYTDGLGVSNLDRLVLLLCDETHSQLVGFNAYTNSTYMESACRLLPEKGSAIGMKAIHLQGMMPDNMYYAVMKDPAGQYWRFAFTRAKSTGDVNINIPIFQDSVELKGTAALGTIDHFFLQPNKGIVYCITADNRMHYYHDAAQEWRGVTITDPDGVLEAGVPAPANWDPVRIIRTDRFDPGQFPWAGQNVALFVTYSEANGGNFYALRFNQNDGADVRLAKTIADVGNVKSISYYIP